MVNGLEQIAQRFAASASVSAEAGIDDDGGGGLEVLARLAASLDRNSAALEANIRNADILPRIVTFSRTALISNNFALVDLGGPNDGYFWHVRLITVSDTVSWGDTMGGATAQVGIGQEIGGPSGQMVPNQVRWPFGVIPNAATFSTWHLTVQRSERLMVQVLGGTNGQGVSCTAVVEQRPVAQMNRSS
jgi:hypothetical protein